MNQYGFIPNGQTGTRYYPRYHQHHSYHNHDGFVNTQPQQQIRFKFKSSILGGYKECILKPLPKLLPVLPKTKTESHQSKVSVSNHRSKVSEVGSEIPKTLDNGQSLRSPTPMVKGDTVQDGDSGEAMDSVSDSSSIRRRRRRGSRRQSRFRRQSCIYPRDEDELMQVYDEERQGGISEEDILENIQTQKEIIDSVKTQPWRMSKKIKMLKLARAYVEKFEGKLSRGKGYQQKWRSFFHQLKRSYSNLIASLVPWEMRIKRIESHFGSVVASYFVFLRWLIWINIWLTFLPVCFIIIPELIVGSPHGSEERKQIPDEEEFTSADLKTIWDAEGIVKYSVVFYGYYSNSPTIGNGYRLPLAYLLTCLASFALSFIFVLKTMAANSRQSRMSTKDEHFTFSWKLFTEWDYMIGNRETANTKHASLVTTFREAILEEEEKVKEGNKHLLLFLRVLANVLILMSLALSTYIIQLFVTRSREMDVMKGQDSTYVAGFWAENELTVIMTLITTLYPNVLDLISLMEKYHPRTNLRLMLARIFALNLLNLYTLFIALYNKQDDLKKEIASETAAQLAKLGNDTVCNSTSPVITGVSDNPLALNCTVNTPPSGLCWETMIGQEVFKLTVMDLIFTIGQIIIIDYIRSVFVRYANSICCWDMEKKFPEYPDFKTAENLLHLINNQGVIWLGTFFAPGLTVLNMFKLMVLVYVRCWSVMVCNVPQERIFRASRSNNFYYALLLVMLFLCMLPPLFAIVGVDPSPGCGPFSNQTKMFHVLTEAMESGLPPSVNAIIDYGASPGVIIPIFLLLLMTIYYLVSVGRSLRESNSQLRMQLEYERTEGRRKVYAMADAKREKPEVAAKPKGKKNITNAVSSVLAAARLAKIMSGGQSPQKGASPGQTKQQIPVAVVQGKRSLKEKGAKERLLMNAFRRRKQGLENKAYERSDGEGEEDGPTRSPITNGVLLTMMSKAAQNKKPRARRSNPDVVQQNIDVEEEEEESSDDQVVLRQSKSMENRARNSLAKMIQNKKASKTLLPNSNEERSRSSTKEGNGREKGQGHGKRSKSNTSIEVIDETVEAEVNICPPSNVKKTNSKTRLSKSRENIQTPANNTSARNNLSAKRNITKVIPKITVEDCSDDNGSGPDLRTVSLDQESNSEDSESTVTESSSEDSGNENLNVSPSVRNTSNESADDRTESKKRFTSLLTKFQESESEGASSDDQNSPDAIAARIRFSKALSRFKKK